MHNSNTVILINYLCSFAINYRVLSAKIARQQFIKYFLKYFLLTSFNFAVEYTPVVHQTFLPILVLVPGTYRI